MLSFHDNDKPMLVSKDVDKNVLVDLIMTRVAARNPEDMRTLVTGQLGFHPGLVLELKRLKSRLMEMDPEQLRVCMIRNSFDFCEE